MHYPKVLERVDSPEEIFYRSFSLGAPEVYASPWARVGFDCFFSINATLIQCQIGNIPCLSSSFICDKIEAD